MRIEFLRNFSFLIIFFCVRCIGTPYNAEECDKMREPKLLRSCCKIPRTDEVIQKCRADLLKQNSSQATQTTTKRQSKIALNICIAECEFRAKAYLTAPYEVDFGVVAAELGARHPNDTDFVRLLLQGFHKCLNFARTKTKDLAWLAVPEDCNFFPATLLACAMEEVYEKCPTRRWHDTPACAEMRNFLMKCDELKSN